MKKFVLKLSFLMLLFLASSCGLFKKKCNCPHFEANSKNERTLRN